jgi:2-C-methyl-D-erythritol 4-phosphate cytidylyltransferase/2-C-methyl-D-erythritol 2,4-cyclodiphosphate synthase
MSVPTASSAKLDIIILAAGMATRFQNNRSDLPKQFQPLQRKSLIAHCLESFTTWPDCGRIVLVLPQDIIANGLPIELREELAPYRDKVMLAVGGRSRAASALRGLKALQEYGHATGQNSVFVAIHDAARPNIPKSVLSALKSVLEQGAQAVIPVLPVSDTIRQKEASDASTSQVIDRNRLMRVQTPQAFKTSLILEAHLQVANTDAANFTDDAMIAEAFGAKIATIAGHECLTKITYAEDLTTMSREMSPEISSEINAEMNMMETRTGSGFDVHKFDTDSPGPIMICGVEVAHDKGLLAHSDGDVGLHALCDAIFGGLATGDIGTFFSPLDPKWKDAASDQFLRFAVDAVQQAGGHILHLDVTIICERPKIGPYREQMQERLKDITGLSTRRLSVKATTSEGLGFTGRGEGIAAMAQASLSLPVLEEAH